MLTANLLNNLSLSLSLIPASDVLSSGQCWHRIQESGWWHPKLFGFQTSWPLHGVQSVTQVLSNCQVSQQGKEFKRWDHMVWRHNRVFFPLRAILKALVLRPPKPMNYILQALLATKCLLGCYEIFWRFSLGKDICRNEIPYNLESQITYGWLFSC